MLNIHNIYSLIKFFKYKFFEGAVSLIGSEHVQSCVGIESVTQAVNDAKENAKMNNIHNCDFIEGKVEVVSTLL